MTDKKELEIMDKQNKESKKDNRLTLDYFIKNKTDILKSKENTIETVELELKRLGNRKLTAEIPDFELMEEIQEMEEEEAQIHILYNCIIEPSVKSKELHEAYGIGKYDGKKIIKKLFKDIEIKAMANNLVSESEIFSVKVVKNIKKN